MNFTRNGQRLGSRHQEHHTLTCRGIWLQLSSEASYLGKGEELDCCPVVQSPLLDESKFCISFGNKVLESGGRVEKLIAQVAWSPVLRFHSLWWFGVQCHLLVLVHCVFLKTNVTAPVYQEILEHFMLPSADQLFKDADFIFQQGFAPAHTVKSTKSWLNDHGVTVLDWPANSPDLNPTEIQDTTMQMTWRPLSKQPGLHYTWAVPQADYLHATPHWCSNSCKRKPNQVLSA